MNYVTETGLAHRGRPSFMPSALAIAVSLAGACGSLPVLVSPAGAQTSTTSACSDTATTCSTTYLTVGDTSTPSSANGAVSTSSQSGTSATSNASNTTISPTISPTTTQNSTNTTTGTISGGNVTGGSTTSTASGGTMTGNTNSATNSTGASTASTGAIANTNSTGASTASTGAITTGAVSTGAVTTGAVTTGAVSTGAVSTGAVSTGAVTTGAVTTGGTTTNVDASDRSTTSYKAIFIPSVVPLTPSSSLAVGNIVKETGACGPLQKIVREPVNGFYFGILTTSRVALGFTDRLVPFLDDKGVRQDYREVPLPDGTGYRLFGHQVTQYTTVLGVAANRNIALGGGSSAGAWGQGGMGTSSSMQQFVTSIQLRECEIGTVLNQPAAAPAPQSAALPDAVYVEKKKIRG